MANLTPNLKNISPLFVVEKGAGKSASYHTPMRYLHLFTFPDAFTIAATIRSHSITMENCSCY
jgi:hypothetical protein